MKIALAPSTQAAEYDRNLAVALSCLPELRASGVQCRIFEHAPLPNDSTAGQSALNREMQAWGPDLTFALHNDWVGDAGPRGILVLIDDDHPELAETARSIGRLAAQRQGIGFEGLRLDSRRFVFWEYSGKGGPPTPNCILWENGNMASPTDLLRLERTTQLQGRALAEAIVEHYGLEDELAGADALRLLEEIAAGVRNLDADHAAQSYRESISLALACGNLEGATELYDEATARGINIRGFVRPR